VESDNGWSGWQQGGIKEMMMLLVMAMMMMMMMVETRNRGEQTIWWHPGGIVLEEQNVSILSNVHGAVLWLLVLLYHAGVPQGSP